MEIYKCKDGTEISYEILKSIENTNIPVQLSLKMEEVNAEKVNFELSYEHLSLLSLFLYQGIKKCDNEKHLLCDDGVKIETFMNYIETNKNFVDLRSSIHVMRCNDKVNIGFYARYGYNGDREFKIKVYKDEDINLIYKFIQSIREDVYKKLGNIHKEITMNSSPADPDDMSACLFKN